MRAALSMLPAVLAGLLVPGPAAAHPPPMVPRDRIPAHLPPEIRRPIERLYSPNDAECTAAARALGEMGEAAAPAAPFLASVLSAHKSCPTPNAAADALVRIGKASTEPVIVTLQLAGMYGQQRACRILARLKDERAVPALVSAAADGIQVVEAHRALEAIGPPAKEYLLRAARDESPALRRRAVRSMPVFNEPDVQEALLALLQDPDLTVRRDALEALDAMDRRPAWVAAPAAVPPHPNLLAALKDPDPRVRRLALKIVADRSRDQALDYLAGAVGDPDPSVQIAAVEALARTRHEGAVGAIQRALESGDSLVRSAAVAALARTGGQAAVPLLVGLLRDPDAAVREKAAQALGAPGAPGRPEVTQALLAAMKDPDPLVRTRAVSALAEIGPDEAALETLTAALEDPDEAVRLGTVKALARMQKAGVGALLQALSNSRPEPRAAAADALGAIRDPRAAGPLLKALDDRAWNVRETALRALARMPEVPDLGPLRTVVRRRSPRNWAHAIEILARYKDKACLKEFAAAVMHYDRHVAAAAAQALGQLGADGADPLFQALKHPQGEVRHHAAKALAQMDVPGVKERLAAALGDADRTVREATASAVQQSPPRTRTPEMVAAILRANVRNVHDRSRDELVRIGGAAVKPTAALLRDADAEVRVAAVEVLGRIADPGVVEPLLGALGDRASAVRRAAARSLAKTREAKVVRALSRTLADEDCGVREAAARALGDLGDAAAVEPLLGALQDPDWHLRWVAAQGLGRLKDDRAAEPLADALKDRHWYVRRAAAEALGALADRRALLALIGALEDEHWYVRASALAALRTATGQDLAPDPKAWRTWLAKNGAG